MVTYGSSRSERNQPPEYLVIKNAKFVLENSKYENDLSMWINKAQTVKDFIVKVWFEDRILTIDFEQELKKDFWYYEPYRDKKKFQDELIIDNGVLAWGENWDLHFNMLDIYHERIGNVLIKEYIRLVWSVSQYAKYFGLTKQAVFKRIWNKKLPSNVVALQGPTGIYDLIING